jgi:N-methylhydantoinase A
VEVVNVRITAVGRGSKPSFPPLPVSGDGEALAGRRDVYLSDAQRSVSCPIYDRDKLRAGQTIAGPAIVEEYASTTLLFPGDTGRVAPTGELIIEIG